MKPALSAIAATVLLGLVGYVTGHPLEIYDVVTILFVTSIAVWTFEQYDHHRQH